MCIRDRTFTVSSNTNWTATKTASWFWINPENGSGDGSVQVNYQENPSTSSRNATIMVDAGGGLTNTVTITQAGAIPPPMLSANPRNINFDPNGGNQTINLSSNLSWTASDDASWLSITPTSGSDNGTITINAQSNSSTSNRIARVTLDGNGVTDVVNVTQAGSPPAPFLSVNPTNITFDASSGNGIISVSSNISWVANDDASWLTLSPSSGINNGSISVSYQENTSTSSRTCLLYTSPSPRDATLSRMPSSA